MSFPKEHQIVIEKVQGIVARRLGIDAARVNGMLFFADDYGARSKDVAAIIKEVEKEFCIKLPRHRCYDVVGDVTIRVVDALAKAGV